MPLNFARQQWRSSAPLRAFLTVVAAGLLFAAFAADVVRNPPGFYVDEAALSYNAYLVSQTGAGESGVSFPLFFPVYTGPQTQYANPTQIYLLAAVFKVFGPGIVTARVFAAVCVFAACLLLGLLARRISGSRLIGIIVGISALATPWLFEVGRLVMETFFYPMAVVLLLWSVYRASGKQRWGFFDTAAIVASLTLLTYSYTIGRLLGPLLATGLILFATNRARIVSVVRVWIAFGLTLIPLLLYIRDNPAITTRFRVLSYIKRNTPVSQIAERFIFRFLEDINPLTMLFGGDVNPRHHLPGIDGSFLAGVFVLAMIGLLVVILRHRRDPWWLYVVFGLLASVVPGALTNDPFHTLRMIAYPIFLLVLTIPALRSLLERENSVAGDRTPAPPTTVLPGMRSADLRLSVLTALLTAVVFQAAHFFWVYHNEGASRSEYFDAGYKILYDEAVTRPQRPIYLVDGYWGPAYIHAYWYATLEGRSLDEFVHAPYRTRPPAGALVLSSEEYCTNCELISELEGFRLYITQEQESSSEIQESTGQ